MKKPTLSTLAILATAFLFATPLQASDSGWQKGCAYKLPSGAYQSGSAMITMYCPMLTACQKMMDQGKTEMMAPMACYGFSQPSGTRKS